MSIGNPKRDKALALLEREKLEGLIVFSNGTCSILRPSYLHYFAGVRPLGPRNAAVVSKAGDGVLLVEPLWDALRVSRKSWIKEVRGTEDFEGDLLDILDRFGIKGPLGIAGSVDMTYDLYGRIEKRFQIIPADFIIEEMAREKTPGEIELVKKTARIADIGFQAFLDHARVGTREYELAAEMEYAMRRAGADDVFILLSSGPHNFEMHEPRDRRLETGDVVIGEITPVCEGQFFQLCRTVILGSASPLQNEKYTLLIEALNRTLEETRAGIAASVISKTMNRVITDGGYGKYCYAPYMRARGHGFGVGSIAPGAVIDDDNHNLLEKNQLVVIHPNQWLPETGYLACGESYLIADEGCEKLSQTETRLYENKG
ncbi:MAG: aminopeptidase P family protein [Deltaproteobacteria bacterium]|nr:aminopeptidase P family protein [Deltaproteobacteria bacterium]MBW2129942.1 aminopeptidase P family protein [Deltaproteobacteria bacterium]